jgi:uncharacterized protein
MIRRTLRKRLKELAGPFPVVFLTGPRQSGKTTLARATFPRFRYVSLEDLQNREEAATDPRGFLSRFSRGPWLILDEVQRVPTLFSYLQQPVDERRIGPCILTGSQQFLLSQHISQTLAGRAAILELLPFSVAELAGRSPLDPDRFADPASLPRRAPERTLEELLFSGLFPAIHDRGLQPTAWLDGYVRTYVERDVRTIAEVGDLDRFARFVALCAGRSGQLVNLSSLGADAGVSHSTARRWLSVLRASYVLDLLPPHHENFSKRLVKTPKLHFLDTGLLCLLLGIRAPAQIAVHPLRGAIFETFVVSELRKLFLHRGVRPPLFFWRDSNGREVDVLIDAGTQRIPVEAKAGATVVADAFRGLEHYLSLSGDARGVLVYGGDESYPRGRHLLRTWWACT